MLWFFLFHRTCPDQRRLYWRGFVKCPFSGLTVSQLITFGYFTPIPVVPFAMHNSYFSRTIYSNKGLSSQGYGFSSGRVWMWELNCEEGWALKNWCFWTVVLEKTLESSLDCKEIQPVHSEGDQPWDFFGRNDAKTATPVIWPPHAKSWLIGKDSDAGWDWGQEETGATEDEMAGWHHWLDGRESEWTPGVGDGQGGLVCCDSWGSKESNTTEWLNWTEHIFWASILFYILF